MSLSILVLLLKNFLAITFNSAYITPSSWKDRTPCYVHT
uniref:Uncharacterized protein n=1 Tax=Arundo donax TaxID=35708 RepID=A0A0A9BFN0_ARUDO